MVLTVSVGSDYIYSDFTSPWSAFTSSSEVYVDVMRCRHRVVQAFTGTGNRNTPTARNEPDGRAVSNNVSCGWIFFSFKVCVQS